ncbi:hypothetical protein [Paenibacillus sp. MBLB4367]|uniref:hypothetical protein n=1 Tax=Paenibacillus sp. MBLB4367 TaxID=3384767 RepID=UPI0039081CB4
MENNHQNENKPPAETGAHDTERQQTPYGSNQPFFTPPPQASPFETPVRRKHSGPGIASFIVSLAMYLVCVLLLVGAVVTVKDIIDPATGSFDPSDVESLMEKTPSFALIGLGFLAVGLGQLVALVLGIIGLAQKERSKVFAILGTVFSGLFVGVIGLIMLIGLAAAGG